MLTISLRTPQGGFMLGSLPVVNLNEATYDCTFGRGCDGICCQSGRPSVDAEERERIDANLHKFLPHFRPEARATLEEEGYLSGRRKLGEPMMRVVSGWCIFFNQGCVLHRVGAEEGDKYRYKPILCSLFPLGKDERDHWFVRQHGYKGEEWDLFCLAPGASPRPATETLQEEVALAAKVDREAAQAAALRRSRRRRCAPAKQTLVR
jgi:Fe-S-cluster containining protein